MIESISPYNATPGRLTSEEQLRTQAAQDRPHSVNAHERDPAAATLSTTGSTVQETTSTALPKEETANPAALTAQEDRQPPAPPPAGDATRGRRVDTTA